MNSKRTKNTRLFSALAGLLIAGAMTVGTNAQPVVWYVDGATGDDGDPGNSWSDAYKTLYKALDSASTGDDIWVAKGTYYPDDGTGDPDNEALSFDMKNQLAVYGGFLNGDVFGDRDPIANETILSGNIGDAGDETDNSNNVVRFDSLTGDPALLDGFTIRAGYADASELSGGGVFVGQTAFAKIRGCTFQDNYGLDHGGGLGVTNNDAGDVIEVRNCRFESNTSLEGGGIGYKFTDGDINIINCYFSANDAAIFGGGLYGSGGNLTIVDTTFTENTASSPGGDGGAAYFRQGADALFINSLFAFNTAADDAGAVCVNGSTTTTEFVNCTLINNHADDDGGGIVGSSLSTTTITNCIVWGNTDGGTDTEEAQILNSSATVNVAYTCVEGLDDYTGSGNIGNDPTFVDEDGSDSNAFDSEDNFRLNYLSPCIDAADNDAVDPDDFDVNEDFDYDQDTPDLDFADRRIDDPDTDDTGNGTPPIVDMGAYEFGPCPWDLDGNCVVGAGDLLLLLADWGNPYGAAELLDLLAAWGPCPCDPLAVVLSLEDELDDACLTQADWDEFEDVMTDPESSQAKKDNYLCWMEHYLFDCNKCFCIGASGCPGADPFDD